MNRLVHGQVLGRAIRLQEEERNSDRLPIVALTAHALEDDRIRCMVAGMDGYLTKPVRLESLGRQLSRWLEPA